MLVMSLLSTVKWHVLFLRGSFLYCFSQEKTSSASVDKDVKWHNL